MTRTPSSATKLRLKGELHPLTPHSPHTALHRVCHEPIERATCTQVATAAGYLKVNALRTGRGPRPARCAAYRATLPFRIGRAARQLREKDQTSTLLFTRGVAGSSSLR
ncbi:hypothetical protein EVAR_20799_1 [Eumeta japonica]|uniref:Uncharacterized protein n=1 Tax=Eumeta variegata TaxID=151549 RepID=A0A4C1UDF6_EUMVA|nr:hypothetical protein EVAR_20799_1 [Eumeta japonica]